MGAKALEERVGLKSLRMGGSTNGGGEVGGGGERGVPLVPDSYGIQTEHRDGEDE